MMENAACLPKERLWLVCRDNWMSDTFQNEKYKCLHMKSNTTFVKNRSSGRFSITADSATDFSACEQLIVLLAVCGSSLVPHNVFLCFYIDQILRCKLCFCYMACWSKDRLSKLVSLSNLQGHCFDEASIMPGLLNGAREKLKEA